MKYVLDASTATRWVLQNPLTSKAVQLRDEYRRGVHELHAPAHFSLEIASALTKAERQKLILVGETRKLIDDVMTTLPVLHDVDPLYKRAVEISSRTRSSFYDCLYVALAEQEGCELITADAKLISNLQGRFPFIVDLATLP